FNCGIGPLIFADQFIQLSSSLASKYIYGLGEHRGSFLHDVNWSRYAFWSRDVFPAENLNLYSVHPFYLSIEDDGNAHGVFLLNSNTMEAILQPSPSITWRTIGGILDFYVFLGPSPDQVIQQYTEVIGRTFMPPYWGLGFHLCRWGYETVDGTRKITDRMRNAKIPQDVQWNDIDYAIDYKDFTLNEKVFGDLPKFIDELHNNDQHYIHIVDPGIAADSAPGTYEPFDLGKKMDIFIKLDGKYIEGKVWTNVTVFPDFINPRTSEWWYRMISEWYKKVHFDGLWIDMNEPVQFGNGSLIGCPQSKYDNPPYTPGIFEGILKAFTLCASADQYKSKHYDVHSLYGLTEMKATFEAIARIRLEKRPFIISRSTYPSSGKYGGHWLGDNFSKWKDMWYSIPGILNFNMFGIPLVGADICGFNNNSNEALCQRWHQLGAFYPFSRNHNSLHVVNSTEKCKDQDPTAFSEAMQISTRDVLLKRYYLLPYLYTLFHKSHVNGTTVARPLFFEFPHDDYALTVDTQFLWGEALLISPVLQEGAVTVTAYFPNHSWYDFDTGACVPGFSSETGKDLNNYCTDSSIPGVRVPGLSGETGKNLINYCTDSSIQGVRVPDLPGQTGKNLNNYTDSSIQGVRVPGLPGETGKNLNNYCTDSSIQGVRVPDLPGETGKNLNNYCTDSSIQGVRVPDLPGETGKNLNNCCTDSSIQSTPMDKINLHIRGGNIIPAQEPGITTKESRQNKFHLIVALCTKNEADGELYLDDGDTLDAYEQELYAYVRFQANATSVISQIVKLGFTGSDSADLGLVKVFGVVQQPSYVSANGVKAQFSYKNKVLTIEKLNLSLLKPFTIVWK
uniref:Lysosomal alpha-glucosidase-like n=1 Tax=Saccoglossus kowalevskii TaxID=10224 RepID=A0ABM0GVL5_SACKO